MGSRLARNGQKDPTLGVLQKVLVNPRSCLRCNQKGSHQSPAEYDVGAAMSTITRDEPVVFVVDDSADVREGLKALFNSAGLECKVFGSPKEFLRCAPENGPSCLVLDVRLPEIGGLDVQTELVRRSRNIPTVIITGHGDIPMAEQAMKAGAISFLTKPVPEQELLDAVYTGIEKDREQLNKELLVRDLRSRYERLNVREREILPRITAGLLNKQIAAEVGLSEVTVKVYRHNLMVKLNAKSLPDLVRMADELRIERRS
jgi:FixJ family two-component response regulator